MKIELLALADFAADYGGKLSVIGIFDTIFARQMPAVHPHCCLAVKLRFADIWAKRNGKWQVIYTHVSRPPAKS